jgi:predicted MFS family arabinose efflux permease
VLRELFRNPGVLRAFLMTVFGRLPMGAISLVLILRTRELTGSYAAGGLVVAASAVSHAIGGPLLGRVIDRRGQTSVLLVAGTAHGCALIAFALLDSGAPLGAAIACAVVIGGSQPPLSPCLRAIWASQITDEDQRHSAYAFESAIFELVYITGPLLFVGLIGAWSLSVAAAACGIVALAGTWLFALTPVSRNWRSAGERAGDWAGALRGPGVRVILAVLFVLGVALAAIEMAIAAFAGGEAKAAVLFAFWGLGSLIGGLIWTQRRAPEDPARTLAVMLGWLALLTAPLALADTIVVLGALMVVAGLAISPAMATGFGLLGQVAPVGTVTEAYTWVATGLGTGIAAGSALGGWLVEHTGTEASFIAGTVALVTAAAVTAAGLHTLRREHRTASLRAAAATA